MSTASFDHPLPHRSVLPSTRLSLGLSAATFAVLVVVQVLHWPMVFGLVVPSVTVAVLTPLLAFGPSGVILFALRRRELRTWAAAHGFTYVRRPAWPLPRYDVAPFNIGRARRRRIVDAITGTVGAYPAWHMHYRYFNNNRVNVSSHYRNVFALTLPKALPPLSIGPTIDTEAGTIITFESIEFNRRWPVRCPDVRFAKAVITVPTMDRLLALGIPVTGNTRIVVRGRELLAISLGGVRGADITRIYAALRIIAAGIPPYVWNTTWTHYEETINS